MESSINRDPINPSPSTAPQTPSTLPPLPTPPFITSIKGIPNLRSIGNIPIPTNKRTLSHIYRSGDPSRLAPESESTLQTTLGITTIFDLRSRGELPNHTLRTLSGITNLHTPVYENKDVSPAEIAKTVSQYGDSVGVEGFVESYCRILDAGVGAFREFFKFLLENPRRGVLVHCSAGKDRTGVVIALVLKVGGVADEDVADEYALTEMGLREWKEGIVEMLLRSEELKGDEVKIRRMLSARREVMVAWLVVLRERYGGAEGYLKTKLGFMEEEIGRIREGTVGED